MDENEYTVYKNLWNPIKAVLGGKFLALKTYQKKGKSQINDLNFFLKKLKSD